MRTVPELMPAGRYDPGGEGRVPQQRGHIAVAKLAALHALGGEEDLEPAQAACLARQRVQGLELLLLGDGPGGAGIGVVVEGQAELCGL